MRNTRILMKLLRRPRIIIELVKAKIIFVRSDKREISEFIHEFKKNSRDIDYKSNTAMRINKIACVEDWRNSEFQRTLRDLFPGKTVTYVWRKHWEWVLGIIAMKRFNMLNRKNIALGVGAGKEDVLFYLANNIDRVYATDLYEGDWEQSPADFVENPKKYAPFNYREEGLEVLRMDGTKLEFPDEMFDIVFSFSSIEHFGGTNNTGSLRSLKEMERVLKNGGLAVVATEYVINGKEHLEFFNREKLYANLIDKIQMKLIEPINFEISPRTLDTSLDFYSAVLWHNKDVNYKKNNPHVIIRTRNILHTSIMLVFQK